MAHLRRERTAAVAHHAGDSLANVIPNHERVHPVRPKISASTKARQL